MASNAEKLSSAFSRKEDTQSYLSNLEKLKADDSVTEESCQALKTEYGQRLSAIDKQIAELKVELTNELQLHRNDLMAYQTELEKLGAKFKVGELPLENYRASDRKVRAKIQKIEIDISHLETLVGAKSYADMGVLASERESRQINVSLPRLGWNQGRLLKALGISLCVVGTIVAVLFVPCEVLGTSAGYHFIFEDAGYGLHSYNFINTTTLILELVFINVVGIALIFLGSRLRPR